MITTVPLTLHLAQAIGLYLVLVGVSGLIAPQRWQLVMDEFAASTALTLVTGVFVFVLGVTLVLVHTILADPLAVIITLVGWIILLEGALLIVAPGPLMRIGTWSLGFTRIWAIVALILGILFGLAGLLGTADPTHFA